MINWNKLEKKDALKISEIVKRAIKLGVTKDFTSLEMDIVAVHLMDCELDLNKLMGFDDGNFGHDVFGISRFIDRDTGILGDSFLPRCAMPETA